MEELKKENKVLKIFILILCFAVGFGLGYYVVGFYTSQDKLEEKETPKEKDPEKKGNEENKENEEDKTPTVVSTIDSIEDYPTSSDNTVKKLGEIMAVLDNDTMLTNFKNVSKTINGSTLNYNCEEYGEAMLDYTTEEIMGNACKKMSVTVDNALNFSEYTGYGHGPGGCSIDRTLYKTDKYYIYTETGWCVGRGQITIYNNDGEIEYEIGKTNDNSIDKKVTIVYFEDDSSSPNGEKDIDTPITFVNDTMYYVTVESANSKGEATLEMRSLDLKNDSLKELVIDTFEGKVGLSK